MSSGVMITVKIEIKPEVVDGFMESLPASMEETKSRPGCQSLTCVRNKDNPNLLLFVETWESTEAYDAYVAWRTERGEMDGYAAIAVGEIEFGYWPETAVSI